MHFITSAELRLHPASQRRRIQRGGIRFFFHFKRSSKASVFSSFSFALFVSISTSTFGIRERRKKTRLKLNYGLCVAVVQRRREVTWLPRQEKPTYIHIYRHIYISIYLDNVLYIHLCIYTPTQHQPAASDFLPGVASTFFFFFCEKTTKNEALSSAAELSTTESGQDGV